MFEKPHVVKSGKAFTFDVHVPNKCQLSLYSYACMAFIGSSKHVKDILANNTNHSNSFHFINNFGPTRYDIGHAYVALGVYSGGIHFETLSSDWLTLLECFMVFLGIPRRMTFKETKADSFQIKTYSPSSIYSDLT